MQSTPNALSRKDESNRHPLLLLLEEAKRNEVQGQLIIPIKYQPAAQED